MANHIGTARRGSSLNQKLAHALVVTSASLLITLLCFFPQAAAGQTQQQTDIVKVYGAYMPMELGMEMVAAKFPSLADRANRAKTDIQETFATTLAFIDKEISTGLPDGERKWPELKRAMRRQLLQQLTTPADIESATRVIQTVEQACDGKYPPTLRATLSTLPSSAHPKKCVCDKCSRQP